MKAFKFEMDQVLRMKRWKEEEAKKALAIEVKALEELKTRLSELQSDRQDALNSNPTSKDAQFDPRWRLGILQYAKHMESLIAELEGEIAAQGQKLKAKADLLLKAMQERKVLEKLKEKKFEEFKILRNRHEYANLDESSAGFLRRNLVFLFGLALAVSQIHALKHTVTNFNLDYSNAVADTFRLDRGWGDSLLISDSLFSYKSVKTQKLSDGGGDNGDAGASPITAMSSRFNFKVAYLSWKGKAVHSNTNSPPAKLAQRANIVFRNITISPDSATVEPTATIYAGLENTADNRFNFPSSGSPPIQNPPCPYYLNFSAEGEKFAAYWGALTINGPIRRITHKETIGFGVNVPVNTPSVPPDSSGQYGTVASALVPNTGGTKAVVVYEDISTPPAGSFRVHWENIDNGTSIAGASVIRPSHVPDDFGIAADSSGNTVVLWRDSSELYGMGYDSSRNIIMPATKLVSGIYYGKTPNLANTHKYRPYAIASMVRGNFLIVYSKGGVVHYGKLALAIAPQPYSFSIPGPLTTLSGTDSCQYPDLAVSADRVVVAWFQRVSLDKYFLKGTIFVKTNSDINISSNLFTNADFAKDTLSFLGMNSNWDFTHSLKSANVAIDDRGNVVAAYDSGFHAKVALVQNTPIYFDSAIFRSKTLRVANPAIPDSLFRPTVDSVHFLSMIPNDTVKIGVSLEVGKDSTFAGSVRNYLPLSNPRVEAAGFFRYRAVLYTTKPTHVTTPKLKNLEINYNVKPRVPIIDSVKAGDSVQVAFRPGLPYLRLMPRKDSVTLVCSAFDLDDVSLVFRVSLGGTVLQSSSGIRTSPGKFTAKLRFMPPDTLLNPLPLMVTVEDDLGWKSVGTPILFEFKNRAPTQAFKIIQNRGRDSSRIFLATGAGSDTTTPASLALYSVQVGDTLTVKITYADRNDDRLTMTQQRNSETPTSNSVATVDTLILKFVPDLVPPLIDTLTLGIGDKDTVVSFKIRIRPNRIPKLDTLVHTSFQFSDSTWKTGPYDKITHFTTDTGLIVPYRLPAVLLAQISDADQAMGDSVSLGWATWMPSPGCTPVGNLECYVKTDSGTGTTISHTFLLQEQYLTLRARDRTGAFLERKIWLEYPYADSGGSGPGNLANTVKVLASGQLSFILGGKTRDTTVSAEIKSSGTANLQIVSISTKQNDQKWLNLKFDWPTGPAASLDSIRFGGRTTDNPITTVKPVIIAPPGKLNIHFTFFSELLRGDSILTDTLLVQTNDFYNPVIKIPFLLKYFDLPVVRISVPGSKPADTKDGFNDHGLPAYIPARSTLAFGFTEPVKVKDPAKVFQIYSYLDSLKNPSGYRPIAGDFSYKSKPVGLGKVSAGSAALAASTDSIADTLFFTPKYDRISDFKQIKPFPGYFVYRDILRIRLTNEITDKLGNGLDLRLNRTPLSIGSFDTVFTARVDTGYFQIVETEPAEGTADWNTDQPMRIRFNRRLAQRKPIGVDTLTLLDLKAVRGDSNLFLKVTSHFQEQGHYNFQFLALEDGDSTLVFKTRPKFPSLDTVTVVVSGGLLDTSGLSLDGNGNKFPDWLFSRSDTVDSYSFSFSTLVQDFYVYPNPFHFSNPKHAEKGAITFKNLNSLNGFAKGQKIVLRVHTMTGDLVYKSQENDLMEDRGPKSTAPYSLDWKLKNKSGATVGTGVYVYTLMVGESKVLRKGKLAVVR